MLTYRNQYALLAKLYKDPLPVLDWDIEHVDASVSLYSISVSTPLTIFDTLLLHPA
jgi:hypothetical protein